MPKVFYGQWDAGVNYRDSNISINELKEVNNLYWEGHLRRRLGYQVRHADLSTQGNYTPKKIYKHVRIDEGSVDRHFLFAGMSTAAASTVDYLAVYHRSGIPTATSDTYSLISSAYWIEWTTSDSIQADELGDKVYLALGDDNPYVVFSTGSSWQTKELPLGYYHNDGATTGANIIDNSSGDWNGSKIITGADAFLFLSDGNTLYFGIREAGIDPSDDINSTDLADRIAGIRASWDVNQRIALNENLNLYKAVAYKKYLFLCGYHGIQSLYPRFVQSMDDYDLITESNKGVWGGINVDKNGIFYVGKDGIYGYDGSASYNLGKKIWPQIKSEHSSIPDDFVDSSIAIHDNHVWISYPDGTSKEVYMFDPDLIYADDRGESYAPFYRFTYTDTTGRTAIGFEELAEHENRLYGLNGNHLYEIDTEGLDNKTTSTGATYNGISWKMKTAYLDQEAPNLRKVYAQVVLETDEGISNNTTGDITDLRTAFSIDHSTDITHRSITDTGVIDTEYTTGGGRVYVTLDVPPTTAGYVLDGNSMAFEIIGESSGTYTTGNVNVYGFTLNYQVKEQTIEEVSS